MAITYLGQVSEFRVFNDAIGASIHLDTLMTGGGNFYLTEEQIKKMIEELKRVIKTKKRTRKWKRVFNL